MGTTIRGCSGLNWIRVEPSRLKEELEALREFMQPECDIYLYCSCARDATSVRVARMLEKENCSTKVIRGGMKAWVKAGGETEPVPLGTWSICRGLSRNGGETVRGLVAIAGGSYLLPDSEEIEGWQVGP